MTAKPQEDVMSDHVYKTIEVTGSSATGSADAIKKVIARASKIGAQHAMVQGG